MRKSQLQGIHFRRQQIIDGFVVDFYCHSAELIVEVDGGVHEETLEYDAERTKVLERRGLSVVRFSNEQVIHKTSDVLADILEAIKQRINPDSPSL